jgi:Ca2+-binding RTX toxin-like protein
MGTEGDDLIIPSIHPLSQNSIINLFGGLWALEGDDRVFGSPFSEIILGNEGEDQLWGGGDSDRLLGGQGNDFLFGGALHDLLRGDLDSDRLWGDEGNDTLRGGQGNDTLQGGVGQDFLVGDLGLDMLMGGGDADTLVLRYDEANNNPGLVDQILDWNGNEDRIGLTDGLTFSDLDFDPTVNVGGTLALDTVIKIRATGQSLGALIDYSSGLSADHFISLSASEMQVGADVFNPQIMPYIWSIPDVIYIPNVVPPIPQ